MSLTDVPETPITIILTDEERENGTMSDKKLYDAIEGFYKDGLVLIENAIDVDIIEKLNERMLVDTKEMLDKDTAFYNAMGTKTGDDGRAGGNLSQVPPLEKEWMYPEIYANKHAVRIVSNILGPQPSVHFIRSNTLIGSTDRQLVHADLQFHHPTHPFSIALNTCLIDVGPENGVTELWLGTQNHDPNADRNPGEACILPESLDARRKVRPPIYPRIKRGTIILRDLRLWHAGMPNPTSDIRIMLSIIYISTWYQSVERVPMPESLKPTIHALEELVQQRYAVEWVPDKGYDYNDIQFKNNFSSLLEPEVWDKAQSGWHETQRKKGM